MNKSIVSSLFVIALLFIPITGCAPHLEESQLNFGIKAAQLDLWDEAIFRWKRAIQLAPNVAAAHNNLAVAFEKKGLWEKAKEEYEIALKLNPSNKFIVSNYEKFKKNYENEKKGQDEKK